MSTSGLEILDTSVQKTNIWLKDLMERLETADRHQAYMALKVTLHALRDRLSIEEAAQLGAQLPMIVRGLYYEGWRPAGKRERASSWESFMKPIYLAVCQDGSWTPEESPLRSSMCCPVTSVAVKSMMWSANCLAISGPSGRSKAARL